MAILKEAQNSLINEIRKGASIYLIYKQYK